MSCDTTIDYCVSKGSTFNPVIRWGIAPIVSKAITAITRAAPAAVTATAHGVVDGWPVAVVSAGGIVEVNAARFPPASADWRRATRVDANTVTLDDVNSSEFTAYTSGGFLVYNTPVDLSTIVTAVFTIYDNPRFTGTALATLAIGSGVTLDNAAKTITLLLQLAGTAWTTGYYQFVVTSNTGIVTELTAGTITIEAI